MRSRLPCVGDIVRKDLACDIPCESHINRYERNCAKWYPLAGLTEAQNPARALQGFLRRSRHGPSLGRPIPSGVNQETWLSRPGSLVGDQTSLLAPELT